jgi:hypothetical protein
VGIHTAECYILEAEILEDSLNKDVENMLIVRKYVYMMQNARMRRVVAEFISSKCARLIYGEYP